MVHVDRSEQAIDGLQGVWALGERRDTAERRVSFRISIPDHSCRGAVLFGAHNPDVGVAGQGPEVTVEVNIDDQMNHVRRHVCSTSLEISRVAKPGRSAFPC